LSIHNFLRRGQQEDLNIMSHMSFWIKADARISLKNSLLYRAKLLSN